MSGGHTKGPWRRGNDGRSIVADYPIENGLNSSDDVQYYGGYLIAESCSGVNIPLLIVAPELLQLLQELVDIEGPQPGTAAWADKVRAAIAKVTGEIP